MRTLLALSAAVSLVVLLSAQSSPPPATPAPQAKLAETAERYLAAYARWDLDALQVFHSDASTWFDPTSAELGSVAGPFEGAKGIRVGLEQSTRGVRDLRFEFDERFVSADRAVAIGRLHYTLAGATLGPGGKDVTFDLRVVTALRIVDGVVVEHVDYSDFSGWLDTVRAAQAR